MEKEWFGVKTGVVRRKDLECDVSRGMCDGRCETRDVRRKTASRFFFSCLTSHISLYFSSYPPRI